jgi:AbrB family looped-hinge helix DNA binding protein
MQVQTVFKAGNSEVVSIPKGIRRKLRIRKGSRVSVEELPGEEAFVVRRVAKPLKKRSSKREFEDWLNNVLMEDEQILNELSIR